MVASAPIMSVRARKPNRKIASLAMGFSYAGMKYWDSSRMMATGRLDRSAGSEVILGVGAVSVQIQVRLINTDQMSRGSCLGQEHLPNGRRFAFGELLGKAPQVTKGACSRLGPSFVRVPSLRRRSVGPRRTDIHVLTALSRHPCRSAHCASSAFGLHPSRDWRCLDLLRMKIKSRSTADQQLPG